MKGNTYVVVGGLWFDKVNGNTYCISKIIDVDTGHTYYTEYQYGYGTHYISAAEHYIRNILLGTSHYRVINAGAFYMKKRELKEKQW